MIINKKKNRNILKLRFLFLYIQYGELAEWSIAAVLKTVELRGSVGSNPTFSANI